MRKKLKIAASILCLTLAGSVLAGCGKEEKTVSTDGSTSMEKVIGALGEQFEADNEGVKFTYTTPVIFPSSTRSFVTSPCLIVRLGVFSSVFLISLLYACLSACARKEADTFQTVKHLFTTVAS